MLFLTIPIGRSLSLDNGRLVLHFTKKSGRAVRIGVESDATVEFEILPIDDGPRSESPRSDPWSEGLTKRTADASHK